ncbi:MAG TPA: NmrA family NAD(P)-binding protein [Bryobacteraceae bacterium]|nr:NmrA family NAD(P)-binding protein [Bryobacteraceae bacterium]
MEFLVIGGTGTVGSQVVRGLLGRDHTVRVLSRTAERAALVPEGARGIIGNLRDPAGLGRAFQDVDGVFLCTPLAQDETEQGLAAVRAARDAAPRKLVYMSVHNLEYGPQIPHFASKVPIEKAVKESGIPYTLLRPNNFFQNDYWYQEAIVKHGIYPQPIGSVGVSRVDVRDIADMAVAALTQPGHDGATYPVVGPDALTGERVAEIWTRHLGREVRYGGDNLEAWSRQARAMLPEWQVHDVAIMYAHFQRHGLIATAAELELQARALHHPPRSFESFAAETAHAWGSRTAAS